MIPAARFTFLGRFAACVVFLGTGTIGVAADGMAPTVKHADGKEAIARWLDRAENYAAGLSEPQFIEVLPTLCGVMLAAGKDSHVDRLLATIKDPKNRTDQDAMICAALADEGKFDAAIRKAQSLSPKRRIGPSGESLSSCRVMGLVTVAHVQSLDYDFAGAKKTIKLIDDPVDGFAGLLAVGGKPGQGRPVRGRRRKSQKVCRHQRGR